MRKMEQEEIEILIKKSTSAQEEIKKIIDVSSFIIDQQALDEWIKLDLEYSRPVHIAEIETRMEQDRQSIDNCLLHVRLVAKNDLITIPEKAVITLKKWLSKSSPNKHA